ncbi:hypothetical protein H112_08757 [Trichophyton rubrum D6]|uniref:2-dehydropantoate 2-reductase n=2 Tax=Trichophyton TaxID=5550 RepID=A0A022VME1_TRIRU|nr:hypothetical protein H100_08779 [Trichophyton rubrum MR850]EZF36734.1 hypothetical protein H102_08738 [Trichophyton rubrum CBS 100081]EZF47482.1 hypothetical protein H103_08761 [Trichophyton rubrum CBS 288.86]EZF79305.1 hypothetical protein H110_08763 [Trichophyton rubrum MR1448]EZF90197.1 hypothetical protein H113_08830 [Trichophyton rubrum MR1459]EZG01306.1 hypothetical protein H106_08634 [Trichophyton rubrum CBS 735.88]EZG11526.1 hypothetical protein H107_08918 [Trichophyton rubrum CBS 
MGRLTSYFIVGGNAVSAFLSWRLQATHSCDVTLVWKASFESVQQYGISFKSKVFGNERFKPRHVVRTPEEGASISSSYDYVILCVKALPDIYDLAGVIESVVTPQHTCILVNTTSTIGIEAHLEQRFPKNVVLSLVSAVDIVQTGASEFEHTSSTDLWVGPASKNAMIPTAIQNDMAAALAITLGTAQVNCKVSENILQQQYDRMIGPIAFYPISVLFETPNHSQLLEKVGVRQMVSDVLDELITLAKSQGCTFADDFKEKTIQAMTAPTENPSIMYQDFQARRPMEIETYLGAPVKMATENGVKIPRIETLYAMLHHINITNQNRQPPTEPSSPVVTLPPRISSAPSRPPMNGAPRGGGNFRGQPPPPRRGPSSMANNPRPLPPQANGHGPRAPKQGMPRDLSYEDPSLDEFSHLVLYEDGQDDAQSQHGGYNGHMNGGPSPSELALKERELMLRQREIALREQEIQMRRRGAGVARAPSIRGGFDDDDEDGYDLPDHRSPAIPQIDPDNFDMMSVTSRRNRKTPTTPAKEFRKNPEMNSSRPPSVFSRHFGAGRHRASARIMEEIPGMHDSLLDNPMMSYSSNRYGNVDRREMHNESRANSLTASRMGEMGHGTFPPSRRTSQSPGNPSLPNGRMGRPGTGPEGGQMPLPNGMGHSGRPSPPGMMKAPVPRHPPGQGNAIMPHQVEQHVGVSNHPYPPKGPSNVRSLTGSASASAESGDSGASAHIDSENSAYSSQSSLDPVHRGHAVR